MGLPPVLIYSSGHSRAADSAATASTGAAAAGARRQGLLGLCGAGCLGRLKHGISMGFSWENDRNI